MAQPISLSKVFPIYKVEHDCILSKQGDVTLAYEATLPEIFTMSDQEYEGFHQILIKRPSRYCPPILFFINRIGSFPENTKQILVHPPMLMRKKKNHFSLAPANGSSMSDHTSITNVTGC